MSYHVHPICCQSDRAVISIKLRQQGWAVPYHKICECFTLLSAHQWDILSQYSYGIIWCLEIQSQELVAFAELEDVCHRPHRRLSPPLLGCPQEHQACHSAGPTRISQYMRVEKLHIATFLLLMKCVCKFTFQASHLLSTSAPKSDIDSAAKFIGAGENGALARASWKEFLSTLLIRCCHRGCCWIRRWNWLRFWLPHHRLCQVRLCVVTKYGTYNV